MYTKYNSKFEMGKKLEIAVCKVQKMEKIQKKHVQWLITQKFCQIMGSYQKKNSLTRF